MTDTAPSSKRRHILSSINPHDEPATPTKHRFGDDYNSDQIEIGSPKAPRVAPEGSGSGSAKSGKDSPPKETGIDDLDPSRPRRTKLKLKDHSSRRRRRSRDEHDRREHRRRQDDDESSRSQRSHRHHRHRRRHRSPTPPNPHDPPPLDSETAFRESLFDAMADDEGASYWESVYGQPIHVYSNERVGPQGELERMTEEEYATYVRQKMWEKTHAGLLEERARREERKKQKKEDERQARKIQEEMEHSLRRGEERRQKKRWAEQWDEYTKAWVSWDGTPEKLAWPVEDSKRQKGIDEKDVRAFFVHGLGLAEIGEQAFVAKLKDERVRWHPDKMQQKLGGKVDDGVMRDVTAVFQIIDKLWGDTRPAR